MALQCKTSEESWEKVQKVTALALSQPHPNWSRLVSAEISCFMDLLANEATDALIADWVHDHQEEEPRL